MELRNYTRNLALGARIVVKAEYPNPAGSLEDWTAALNTAQGYRIKIYASENISPDKVRLLKDCGAELVTISNAFFFYPEGLEKVTARIRAEIPYDHLTDQLSNPANPQVHLDTTGPEMWQAIGGTVAAFVAGVRTGGTVSGVERYLKADSPGIHVVVAGPDETSLSTEENLCPIEIDGFHRR